MPYINLSSDRLRTDLSDMHSLTSTFDRISLWLEEVPGPVVVPRRSLRLKSLKRKRNDTMPPTQGNKKQKNTQVPQRQRSSSRTRPKVSEEDDETTPRPTRVSRARTARPNPQLAPFSGDGLVSPQTTLPSSPTKASSAQSYPSRHMSTPLTYLDQISLNPPSTVASQSSLTTAGRGRAESPSKAKNKRRQLESTDPKHLIGLKRYPQEYREAIPECANDTVPSHINHIMDKLSMATALEGCIPLNLASEVRNLSQGMGPIPQYVLSAEKKMPCDLNTVTKFYSDALDTYTEQAAEDSWGPLASRIMEVAFGVLFEVKSTQHSCVLQEFLPRASSGSPIGTVKVDYRLHLREMVPRTKELITLMQKKAKGGSISAFADAPSARSVVVCAIELKGMHGDYEEAAYQYTVASSGMRSNMERLASCSTSSHDFAKCLPIVGMVVQGHFWSFHLSYREESGATRVLGPYRIGGTSTFLDIFCLINFLTILKDWLLNVYTPFLEDLYADVDEDDGVEQEDDDE